MKQWPRQKDLLHLYGNPSTIGWAHRHITQIAPPFCMYAGKMQIHNISINIDAAAELKAILNEIWGASGESQKKIHEWGMDRFDGSFVVRSIRGGKSWSTHAFGLAVDFDARRNPLGTRKGNFTKDHPVVRIFEAHGWTWGGRWKRRPDPMHFQAAKI